MGLTRVSGSGCILGPLRRWLVYPCRNYSAVCVYSLGDIDKVFRTSSLKGYHMGLPSPRPGMVSCCQPRPRPQPFLVSPPSPLLAYFFSLFQCLPKKQPIPTETFQVADSHPEVAQRVEPMGPLKTPLFHSKYHYQKVVVHRMQASNRETFHVLYLTTGDGLSQNSLIYFVKIDRNHSLLWYIPLILLLKRQK